MSWWDKLTTAQKKDYIKKHPNSKHAPRNRSLEPISKKKFLKIYNSLQQRYKKAKAKEKGIPRKDMKESEALQLKAALRLSRQHPGYSAAMKYRRATTKRTGK